MSKFAYQPGDVIEDKLQPFSKILLRNFKTIYCDNCFKHGCRELKRCIGCKLMFYCSQTCQKEDWKKGHKVKCSSICFHNFFDDSKFIDVEEVLGERLILRTFAALKLKPNLYNKKIRIAHTGEEISFNLAKLKHETLPTNGPSLASLASSAALRMNADANLNFDINQLKDILIVHGNNSHPIFDGDGEVVIGIGIYLQLTAFEHSCKPNTYFSAYGNNPHGIRAVAPIGVNEKCTVAYAENFGRDKVSRIKNIEENFGFICHCELCESDVEEKVDYQKLTELMDQMEECSQFPKLTFSELLETHNQILEICETIYHKYDRRIILMCIVFVHAACFCPIQNELEAETRKNLMEEIKQRVSITLGASFVESVPFVHFSEVFLGLKPFKKITGVEYAEVNGKPVEFFQFDHDEPLSDTIQILVHEMEILVFQESESNIKMENSDQNLAIENGDDSANAGGDGTNVQAQGSSNSKPEGLLSDDSSNISPTVKEDSNVTLVGHSESNSKDNIIQEKIVEAATEDGGDMLESLITNEVVNVVKTVVAEESHGLEAASEEELVNLENTDYDESM